MNTVLSLGFAECVPSSNNSIVCFDPQCLMMLWVIMKGKPVGAAYVPVCTQSAHTWPDTRQWLAHLLHVSVTDLRHLLTCGSCPGTKNLGLDGRLICTFFCLQCLKACWSAHRSAKIGLLALFCLFFNGRILPISLCGMRMNLICKKKKKKSLKKKCFLLLLFSFFFEKC